jgi:hypothetical protein
MYRKVINILPRRAQSEYTQRTAEDTVVVIQKLAFLCGSLRDFLRVLCAKKVWAHSFERLLTSYEKHYARVEKTYILSDEKSHAKFGAGSVGRIQKSPGTHEHSFG